MATLKSIAAEAGVSPMVVSAVVKNDFSRIRVSEPVREKIQDLIKKHNYVPSAIARSLSRQSTNQITAFIPSFRFFEVSFQNKVMTAIQKHMEAANYRISFCSYKGGEAALNDVIADAGLFFYYGPPNVKFINQIQRLPFPLVIFGDCQEPGLVTIYRDSLAAMKELTEQLLEKGHRRFTYVSSSTGDVHNYDSREGVRMVLAKRDDIVLNEMNVYEEPRRPLDENHIYLGHVAAERLLEQELPDIIIFESDTMALGVLREFNLRGIKVPADVSIAANGTNAYTQMLDPQITKVTSEPYEIGKICAETVLASLRGNAPEPGTRIRIPEYIEWGESVADMSDH